MFDKIKKYIWIAVCLAVFILCVFWRFSPHTIGEEKERVIGIIIITFFFANTVFTLWKIGYIENNGQRVKGNIIRYDKGRWRQFGKRTPVVTFKINGKKQEKEALNVSYFGYTEYEKNDQIELLYADKYPNDVLLADSDSRPTYVVHVLLELGALAMLLNLSL